MRKAELIPPKTGESSRRWGRSLTVLGGAAIIVATVLAYLPALHAGFIWDDDKYVTENAMLTVPDGMKQIWFSAHYQSQYFPLVYTTLRFERALWGLNPMGYHIVNILLHVLNALLVWMLLRRLAIPGAWLAAALWALHPVQVESVAWITELKNTQSTLFFMLAVLAWLRFTDRHTTRRWWFYVGAFLLQAMALFSKTTACTLPAALLLVVWWRGEAIGWRRIAQVVPFLVLGVAMGLVSVWWEGHMGNYQEESGAGFGWLERLLIATRALWFYAGKLLWPATLTFIYPKWEINARVPMQYAGLIACVAVAWLLCYQRKWIGRGVIAGVTFFVATLSPLLGFIWLYTFRYSFVADHYQYVASLGLLAIAGAAIHSVCGWLEKGKPFVRPVLYGALLVALGVLTWRQCGMYRDAETLWRTTLVRNPACWMAHINLGLILARQGRLEEAITHYREALLLEPGNTTALSNLGGLLAKQGKFDEAQVHLKQAIQIQPGDAQAHNNLGLAFMRQGRLADAVACCEESLRLEPNQWEAHHNLALAFGQQGKLDFAVKHFQLALAHGADSVEVQKDLRDVLAAQGRLEALIADCREAIRLRPDGPKAFNNLAWILATHPEAQFRDGKQAVEYAARAVELTRTNDASKLDTLAAAYAEAGRFGDALEVAKKAVALAKASGDEKLAGEIETRLRSYENRQPFREAAREDAPPPKKSQTP
jgi:tetratricopeptide (TPR) repeat protein